MKIRRQNRNKSNAWIIGRSRSVDIRAVLEESKWRRSKSKEERWTTKILRPVSKRIYKKYRKTNKRVGPREETKLLSAGQEWHRK